MARVDLMVGQSQTNLQFSGAGTVYMTEANNGAIYCVYADSGSDVVYRKSLNRVLS